MYDIALLSLKCLRYAAEVTTRGEQIAYNIRDLCIIGAGLGLTATFGAAGVEFLGFADGEVPAVFNYVEIGGLVLAGISVAIGVGAQITAERLKRPRRPGPENRDNWRY